MNTTPQRDNLTEIEASVRAAQIGSVSYNLRLDLTPGAGRYRGDATIHFTYSGDGDVFLDHTGDGVALVEINGEPVATEFTDYRIILPGSALEPTNDVRVVYEHEYDHVGDGFHEFTDPADGRKYLYTNFEPFSAHHLLPCFDQPDIKAVFSLAVEAPQEWTVISNARLAIMVTSAYGTNIWAFHPTTRISTYLFGVMAGHWHGREFEHNGIPLGLYCRQSVAHLLSEHEREIIEVTSQGLDFYAGYFGISYEFGKYDQIFVPEFNVGAMENPGAVTITDSLLFRDPPTDHQRLDRADLILHEMAHMWFGDLVTMRWWADLWLNESFATYMSHVALSATRFSADAWLGFNAGVKSWAYQQDQLETTHPVAGHVPDTDATRLNFDGITYGKGAALIQQLMNTVGADAFQAAMHDYFVVHRFANATLTDFLAAIGAHTTIDIEAWADTWISTAGLNTLELHRLVHDDGTLDTVAITQTAPAKFPTLRQHALSVAIVTDNAAPASVRSLATVIDGAHTEVMVPRGIPAPVFMMPNYDDRTYAAIMLDNDSAGWLLTHVNTLADPLMRLVGWQSLWHMVREERLGARSYLVALRSNLPLERSLPIISYALATSSGAITRYVTDGARETERSLMFATAIATAELAGAGGHADLRRTWLRHAAQHAFTEAELNQLHAIPNLDQSMRWTLAIHAAVGGLPTADALRAAEMERDPSDRGQRAYLTTKSAVPDEQVKASVWAASLGSGYGSLHLTEAAMSGFHWQDQRELLNQWVEPFFETVPSVFRNDDAAFASAWFSHMFPHSHVTQEVLTLARALDDEVGPDLPVLSRMLREEADRLDRALRCRVYDEASYL